MKIVFVNDTFLQGRGADNVIYNLARLLGKKHQVIVLAGETNIKEENFKFIKIPLNKLFTGKTKDFFYFKNMEKLRRFIYNFHKLEKPDVYNIHHLGLIQAFKRFNINTFYTWHGSPPSKNFFRQTLVSYFQNMLEHEKVICISNYLLNECKKLGVKWAGVIHEGVDKIKYTPTWEDKDYMLYVGRLEKHKHVEKLIKVSKELKIPLKIAGYGTEIDSLRFAAKGEKQIKFLGRVSDEELIKLYQECSFFVSASEWECFGLIFLEAGCCGKPSILFRIKEMPTIVEHAKTCLISNNYDEFKCYVDLLWNSKSLRTRMGKKAYEKYKKYTWDKTSKEYEKCLKEIK